MKHRAGSASNKFSGEIVVASRIVDYLSSGLYESPAACLKELINNSYDADATDVKVFVQPDANRIIIDDNGSGMTRAEFIKNFSRISETFKRVHSDVTRLGRPKIGKIGIGFIAANEICDVMEIHTTKLGSTELVKARINFAKMRDAVEARRRDKSDFAKGDYEGVVERTSRDEHYTRLFLTNVRGEAREILAGAIGPSDMPGHTHSLYGMTKESIRRVLASGEIRDWNDFDSYSKTMLLVGLNVPVRYHEQWLPPHLQHEVASFVTHVESLNFNVYYDNSELRKPVVLIPPSDQSSFISVFAFVGHHLSAKGYYFAQHGTLRPQDLQGVLIRIRNTAVGGYDPTFMNFPTSEYPLFQRWISAEIWASDELEDAMNIDRKTLRLAHPAYVELQQEIHKSLVAVLKRARTELYGEASDRKRSAKSAATSLEIEHVAGEFRTTIGASAATAIGEAWQRPSAQNPRLLLATYTVPEILRLALEVGKETLPMADLRRFLKALARRLAGERER